MTTIASEKQITVDKLLWATGVKVALTIVALLALTVLFFQTDILTAVYLSVLFIPPLLPLIAVGALILLPLALAILWVYIHFYLKSLRALRQAYALRSPTKAQSPRETLGIMLIVEIVVIGLAIISVVGLPLTLLAPLALAGAAFAGINGYILYVLAQQDALLKSVPQSAAPEELQADAS